MLESTIAIGSYVILFVFSYLSFTEYLFRNYENSKSVTFTFALTLASSLSMLQLLVFEISGGLSLNMKWTLWRVHLGILIVDLVFILPIFFFYTATKEAIGLRSNKQVLPIVFLDVPQPFQIYSWLCLLSADCCDENSCDASPSLAL